MVYPKYDGSKLPSEAGLFKWAFAMGRGFNNYQNFGLAVDKSSIEPKVSIMGIRSNGNIWDAGFNYTIVDQVLNSYIMYRSTGAVTTGMGIVYRQLCFSGMYTSATKALSSYTNGNFEVGMSVRLFK